MTTESKKNFQVWKAQRDSDAGLVVTPTGVSMIGNKQNAVHVDSTGVAIGGGGNVSINTTSDRIRQDGMLVQRAGISQMIPTTIVTPAPQLIPWPPLALVGVMLATIPIFIAALQ